MTRVLSLADVLALAQRRAEHRDAFVENVRLILRVLAERADEFEPFEHGSFRHQVAHEMNSILVERGDPLATERRTRRNAKISARVRKAVLKRDGYACVVCGFKLHPDEEARRRQYQRGLYLTVDHKIPLSEGGPNHISNMETRCGPCNNAKGKSVPAAVG